jgi:hypothetical protein
VKPLTSDSRVGKLIFRAKANIASAVAVPSSFALIFPMSPER